jgi:hypothetical protein
MTTTPIPTLSSPFIDLSSEATAHTLITALIHRYAVLARESLDISQITPLFHPLAKIHSPDGRELAPEQLGEIMGPEPPKVLRHNVTTMDIQFVSTTEARCMSYVVAATDKKCPDHWGVWEDVVRSVDGRWLFWRKEVVVEGFDRDGWLAGVLDGMRAGKGGD